MAQSTVNLYGVVDSGIRFIDQSSAVKGSATWSVTPGGSAQSLLGMRGTEDLGDGTKALFRIESRFFTNSGALDPSHPYLSTALVGIESNRFGRLTIGRQTNPLADAAIHAFASNPWLPTFYLFRPEATMAAGVWTDNMVKYTASASGLTLQLSQALGNQAGHMAYGSQTGASMTYVIDGSLALATGYLLTRDSTNGSPAQMWTFGGSYWFGNTRIHFGYSVNRLDPRFRSFGRYSEASLSALGMIDLASRTMYATGITHVIGRLHLSLNFWRTLQTGNTPNKDGSASQIQFVGDYALSKRTALYNELDYSRYSGGLIGAQLQGNNTVMPPVSHQLGAMVGIRHRF